MSEDPKVNFGLQRILSIPDLDAGCWFPQPHPSAKFVTPDQPDLSGSWKGQKHSKHNLKKKGDFERTLL
jgi:hypothetical protein